MELPHGSIVLRISCHEPTCAVAQSGSRAASQVEARRLFLLAD